MLFLTSALIGTVLEILTYGIYIAVFFRSLTVFCRRREQRKPTLFLAIATCALFIVTTATVSYDVVFLINVFKNYTTQHIDYSGYPAKHIATTVGTVLDILISDAILFYRSYTLFLEGRRCLLVISFSVYNLEIALGIWSIISVFKFHPHVNPLSEEVVISLSIADSAYGALALFINLIFTISFVICLWRSHHRLAQLHITRQSSSNIFVRVGTVIVSSAAANIVWMVCVFSTSVTSSVLYEIFSGPLPVVTALIFSLVVVQSPQTSSHPAEMMNQYTQKPVVYPQVLLRDVERGDV
ncbi:hypothetical protein GYMLUDRAFT_43999 [Collybiopsis luxurians FD-317 M1]|uniref:Uncharacterized protein n=1 Tax=Collybiopsis luxurians FD-317 M1 TaxID=944289 RepID=A0A0D0BWL9_9AGAR|nr:hypothetical protein GYMLUDRAFT_43999 [Collybiopsis luxurians FD-317 M1]